MRLLIWTIKSQTSVWVIQDSTWHSVSLFYLLIDQRIGQKNYILYFRILDYVSFAI